MQTTEEAQPIFTLRGHSAPVLCFSTVAKAGSPTILASGAEDGTARIWDIITEKCVRGLKGFAARSEVTSLCFTSEETLYAAAGREVKLFDLRSPSLILTESTPIGIPAEDEINQITVNDRRTFLATADDSGQINVVDLRTLRSFKRFRKRHASLATCVRFQPNRTWDLWSGGMDSTLIHWDFSKGCPVEEYSLPTEERTNANQMVNPPFAHFVEFSPEGRTLAMGLGDGSVGVMRYSPGIVGSQKKGKGNVKASWVSERLFDGHNWAVTAVTFPQTCGPSSARSSFLSGGIDGKLILWDMPGPSSAQAAVISKRLHIARKVNCLAAFDFPTSASCDVGDGIASPTNDKLSGLMVFVGGALLPTKSPVTKSKPSPGDIDVYKFPTFNRDKTV